MKKAHTTHPLVKIAALIVLIAIGGLVFYRFNHYIKQRGENQIIDDIENLEKIFNRINEKAHIVSIKGNKSDINFLTIKKGGFAGSEVGPLNLRYPDLWEGPYMQSNPMIQGKYYQIVRTNQGYFIVPGEGVKLPNGKIIGTDIMLTPTLDIGALMKEGQPLMYNNKKLALSLSLSNKDLTEVLTQELPQL